MEHAAVLSLLKDQLGPAFTQERARLDVIDKWARWEQEVPRSASSSIEYAELAKNSRTPWGMLIVSTFSQSMFVEGYRGSTSEANSAAWSYWQANGMDARQIAIHRAILTFGKAYTLVLPGKNKLTGEAMPSIRGFSPRHMIAMYADNIVDDWPIAAARFTPTKNGIQVKLYDEEACHTFTADSMGFGSAKHLKTETHGMNVCPIVRFENLPDLEGRSVGEVEPIISTMARMNQTKFDRLVVQRFASFVVRTITGIDLGDEAAAEKLRLAADNILVAKDEDAKFGSLPASPIEPFDKAYQADGRDLSAVTQLPPHALLGAVVNLSAEALAAANAGKEGKVDEKQHSIGESYEQTLRLAAAAVGNLEAAGDYESAVIWKDTGSRSLAQTADALGKIATMLGVPVEMLWEDIPGWTQEKVERARKLLQEGDVVASMVSEMLAGADVPQPEPV